MNFGRTYLAAFAGMHALESADERRGIARQGLAMIAQIAEREPAPLEGLPEQDLLKSVRIALTDGSLFDLGWLAPSAAAVALFELAQALPPGSERRELGRRVLTRLREADRETFVRLLIAMARSSPRLLASDHLRARTEVVLAAPLTAPGAIGELALGILAQPALALGWVETPASGSLPARRLAARILAHGAREALRRQDRGDRGGIAVLARPGLRAALTRLLADREALVWRFAAIARGLLAHVDSDLADAIDRGLRETASQTDLRRAACSAAAALERGGAALRWNEIIVARAERDAGVARGAILGLAGFATSDPESADALAATLVDKAPMDAVEALAELRREEGLALLPVATEAAIAFTRGQLGEHRGDDGRWALLHALDAELAGGVSEGVGARVAEARAALDAGDVADALGRARLAVQEVVEAADWLERATDDDPIDRRHSMRLLRELDRELLADNTLNAVLGLAAEGDPTRQQFAAALASIENALLAREATAEAGDVAHAGLRVARLRALVRLLDGVRATNDADLGPRLAVVRRLMTRAATDHSALRRAVWAAMTRAGDALLRDGHAEITDLLIAWATSFPDEDFAIVREASMVPEVEHAFDAYVRLQQAGWAAADPDDSDAVRACVERLSELAGALPAEQSPRVESVRLSLARLGNQLARITAVTSQAAVPRAAVEELAAELGALARRCYGARLRLGETGVDRELELEGAAKSIAIALGRDGDIVEEAVGETIDACKATLPPAIAGTIERVLLWLARRPTIHDAAAPTGVDTTLPSWVPLSRLLGGFYVVRPIGRGAGGSVLLAVRATERSRSERELVALKVPEYSGGAARNLSESEFEVLFREEAGALLALPEHPNIARFITFDASARPKPILVMEYVRGDSLERALEQGELDLGKAIGVIDNLLAGLEAMHKAGVVHLDVKPANVVIRPDNAVLVDFGLAGRRLRPGCGSPNYGAREVWVDEPPPEPFPADVYAAACVAFEVLTTRTLIGGDELKIVLDQHFSAQPGAKPLAELERRFAPLAQLLRAAVQRDWRKRPTIARFRAGFAAIAPELRTFTWPLA